MKKLLLFIFLLIISTTQLSAGVGCVPNQPTGTPSISPVPDSFPCIVVGDYFNQSIYLENLDTTTAGGYTIIMDSIRIDTIQNVPCGINYLVDNSSLILPGATACIYFYGNTADPVGQYKLRIVLSVYLNVSGLGAVSFVNYTTDSLKNALAELGASLPFNFDYYFRVINCPTACVPIDTSASANNLTSNCSSPFKANIVPSICGNACPNTVDTLTAVVAGTTDSALNFTWVTIKEGVDSIISYFSSVIVTAPDSVFLVASDDDIYDTIPFYLNATPTIAGDSIVITGGDTMTIFNKSTGTNITIYSYTITDSSSDSIVGSINDSGGSFVFTANGTYIIKLAVYGACGNSTRSDTVHITSIMGINGINNIDARVMLYPNPATGTVNLLISSPISNTESYTVQIFDMEGKLVYAEMVSGNVNKILDLSYLSGGVYLVRVNSQNISTVQKLVVQ